MCSLHLHVNCACAIGTCLNLDLLFIASKWHCVGIVLLNVNNNANVLAPGKDMPSCTDPNVYYYLYRISLSGGVMSVFIFRLTTIACVLTLAVQLPGRAS